MDTSLFSQTPSVAVFDNRGLTVRNIAYHRHPDALDITEERVTRHQYDARSFLMRTTDPRLYETGLANFSYLTDLTGSILRTQGADNGTTVSLNDAAGRPFIVISNMNTADGSMDDRSQAVTRTWQYEAATLPGRLLSITEQSHGDDARITERFVYAGNSGTEKALNLAGQCVSHYDTAGLVQAESIALTGVPQSVTRHLLKKVSHPGTVADWQGADASAWNDLLATDSDGYSIQTSTDATGAVLNTTDAAGNQQRVAYDVGGLVSASWLTLKGEKEQIIVASLTYSAAGQKLREAHGNGVVTTYTYELETQRLTEIKTERPSGHASGTRILQDMRYEYDPVGNVLKITNDAEKNRFWRNQKVVPGNKYLYDSLYQLVSATGREMANAGQQGSPSVTVPLPTDDSAYTNYTRHYTYDSAGNLTQVRHSAPASNNSYTIGIIVSDRSNRGVLSTLTENISAVDGLFTAGGLQKQLQPGVDLVWSARNELINVMPIVRKGSTNDSESYRYDGNNQRILKVSTQKTDNSVKTKQALYLPGLELRSTKAGEKETESLQVITVGEAGCAQVRVLYWNSGKPDGINNGQIRYSYDNLIGSGQLELDGDGNVISMEEYYPYGGTSVWAARSQAEADYKTIRYSGKERDATGLYYYGYRYYQPWAGRWLSADPAGAMDGINLFQMVQNNPVTFYDNNGLATILGGFSSLLAGGLAGNLPSFSWPDLPDFSFSFPDFSIPSFTFSEVNPVSLARKAGSYIYHKGYKKMVNKIVSGAKNDKELITRIRIIKTVGLGVAIGAGVGITLISAGTAIPIILGGIGAATIAGGLIGYFSSVSSSRLARGLHHAPGPTSVRSTIAAQVGNSLSGGAIASARNTLLINSMSDSTLKHLGKSSEIRITTGNEIGVAAGTDVQLHGGKPGRVTQYTAPAAVAVAAIGTESYKNMEGVGELAAAFAYEGAAIGKKIDKGLGFTGKNFVRRFTIATLETVTGVEVPDHPAETILSAVYSSGKLFLRNRKLETNNFESFRRLSID